MCNSEFKIEACNYINILQVSCSKQLPVFKQLMETTGDLQKSAINQMRLFNNFGTYEISDGSELLCSSEAAIKLHIDEGEGQGSRLVKFGELLELNNKLVLVSGSQAENGEFLNVSICWNNFVILITRIVRNYFTRPNGHMH